MRILVFCQRRSEIAGLHLAFAAHNLIAYEKGSKQDVLKRFCENDNVVIILPISYAATGFRVPFDTVILFTGTVKDGPEKEQAMARALIGV